ncbi:PKD domain-containing protein [Kitasatospora sp. NPDC091335]|uniref:PKD domain-containing protein n=1 Tax=Kitasatospora sp. NPDC091335 TaxID=3364085 RepID=UPI0037FFCE29
MRQLPGRTYSSPAERTVATAKPGVRAGLAAPAQGAQGSQSSQHFWTSLDAMTWGAHEVDLRTYVSVYEATTVDVTIAWGDGTTDTFSAGSSASTSVSDSRVTKHNYAAVGSYQIKVTVKDPASGGEAVNQVDFVTGGSEFTPHAPTRLLDTRSGLGAAQAKVPGRGTVALKVAGTARIPANVATVVLNVTATGSTGSGHVSVASQKDLAEGTETSNLNYAAGQTVPNLVTSYVGKDGYVYLYNAGWEPVDLLADVTGYFSPQTASGYGSVPQTRVVDTRESLGTAKGQVAGQSSFDVAVAGRNGVPGNATAVALNLTVTGPQEAGHLIAYPSGQAAPTTSSVNFTAGQTVANAVIVPVGPDGKISIRNGSWRPTDVVIDVVGYYTPDSRSAFVSGSVSLRLVDSRTNRWGRPAGPLHGRDFYAMRNESDTTTPRVDGWVLNTTVTNTTGPGFLSVTPDPNFWSDYQNGTPAVPQRPVSSTLNWTAGATVANIAQTPGGKGGIVDIWNQGWQDIDFMVDLFGYYQTI